MKTDFNRLTLSIVVLLLTWGFVSSFNQGLHGFLTKRFGNGTKTWIVISMATLIVLVIVVYCADLDFCKIAGVDLDDESDVSAKGANNRSS